MKHLLIFIMILVSTPVFCQKEKNQIKDDYQEGLIYRYDMNKHICGQKYYIKTGNDTILINKRSMNIKIDRREFPLKVYLTISGNDNNESCLGNYKKLSYIRRK